MVLARFPTTIALLLLCPAASRYIPPSVSGRLLRTDNYTYPGDCPCRNASHCSVQTTSRFPNELFVFHVAGIFANDAEWRQYDWSRLTTIAMWEFAAKDAELYCYAHSLGVRVVLPASPPVAVYGSNATARQAWAEQTAATVRSFHADGINVDTEDAIAPMDVATRAGLTETVRRARKTLDAYSEHAILTIDVGWLPGVDGRFYDYAALADTADFLVIMSYDMASYIWGACVATPNSPPPQVEQGLLNYLAIQGVEARDLVLALPWYGRTYRCANGTAADARYCPIAISPWRDANCTDAGANPVAFGAMAQLLKSSKALGPHQRDDVLQSPFVNMRGEDGGVEQLWYDDVESLSVKYRLVHDRQLLGVGIWTPNMLDYGKPPFDGSTLPEGTQEMWDAVSTVPFGL